jgi:hypothetical protein
MMASWHERQSVVVTGLVNQELLLQNESWLQRTEFSGIRQHGCAGRIRSDGRLLRLESDWVAERWVRWVFGRQHLHAPPRPFDFRV